ncbi:hypothetical protein FACS1894154_08670 [Betaproteobacteria bacterium]|nr:hypothetical protein FACS1894154_08670 [Betaproteobacteria bacterium]
MLVGVVIGAQHITMREQDGVGCGGDQGGVGEQGEVGGAGEACTGEKIAATAAMFCPDFTNRTASCLYSCV